jgi:hypothetical protein
MEGKYDRRLAERQRRDLGVISKTKIVFTCLDTDYTGQSTYIVFSTQKNIISPQMLPETELRRITV